MAVIGAILAAIGFGVGQGVLLLVRVLRGGLESAPGLDITEALDPHLATAAMLVLHRDPQGRVVAVEHHHVA